MKTCRTCKANKVCDHNKYGFEDCGNYIPLDSVEVVRCEKCRAFDEYHYPVEDFDGRCVLDGIERDKDFYCAYGKKKST